MAITNYLVHFKTNETFKANKDQLRNNAVAFVGDATIIHTHGTDYYCGSGPVALESDLANYATTSALTSGLAGKANTSHTHSISQISDLQNELDDKASSVHYHSANDIIYGTISLDRLPSITDSKITSISADKITGTIPQENLPSYVDDVLEYSNRSSFPDTGETGKIYIDTSTNLTYRWGGSTYVEIGQSLALGETSSTAYRGDRGASAYNHSQTSGNPHNLSLSDLGITVSATELNYVDGVNANIQIQLNGKANKSHDHTTSQILGLADVATSGSYNDLSDKPEIPSLSGYATQSWVQSQGYITTQYSLPTASSNTLGGVKIGSGVNISSGVISVTTSSIGAATEDHTHSNYLTSADLSDYVTNSDLADYALKSEIPDVSNLATKSELEGYLPLTGGTLTGSLFFVEQNAGIIYSQNAGLGIKSTNNGNDPIALMGGGISLELTDATNFTIDGNQILTEANWEDYITAIDTKNTTGTSNSISKLYLVGGNSQSNDGVVTYSNSNVYTQSGQLYATRMNTTSGFYETSDKTLKDIESELNIADNIDKIPTILFSWKKDKLEDGNKDVPVHIGTIAQDIQKIYPDLVANDAEGHLTVDYARLSVIAIASIKELKKEIDMLKASLIK